jgi:hypothetical protein
LAKLCRPSNVAALPCLRETDIDLMIGQRLIGQGLGFLAAIFLLCAPLCANAQGYPSGIKSGTNGSTPAAPAKPSNPGALPNTAPSTGAVGNRNMGTGQGRTEGAMGMTPQLQKELGLNRQ